MLNDTAIDAELAAAQRAEATAKERTEALTARANALRALDRANARLGVTAPSAPSPVAASRPASAPAPSAPPRPKWSGEEMAERIARIAKSPFAKGQENLAVMLCSSGNTIDESIQTLRVAGGLPATEGTQRAGSDAGIVALSPAAIFASRKAQCQAARAGSSIATAASAARLPKPAAIDADAVFASRRAACQRARNV